ncbi:MAG: hypothetical protein WBF64_02060, partial [Xanthobacteraceae bacterium]
IFTSERINPRMIVGISVLMIFCLAVGVGAAIFMALYCSCARRAADRFNVVDKISLTTMFGGHVAIFACWATSIVMTGTLGVWVYALRSVWASIPS